MDYVRWHLFYKYAGRKWEISFDNGFRSLVYPYPDHDAGEANIWTRNVDWYDTRFIRSILRPGEFIVDGGCNVGNRTLALADVVGGALLIDAGRRATERARDNLRLNNLDLNRFVVVHAAIGDRQGIARFSDLGGASTINRVLATGETIGAKTVEVRLTTIDDELERIGRSPSFIKIDVEGHDFLALNGCARALRSGSVRLVKFEHNQRDPLEPIEQFFGELGWQIFALDRRGNITFDKAVIASNMNLFAAPPSQFQAFPNCGLPS
jgi:FkbM family methyltransferase